jgi:hypothetical protein
MVALIILLNNFMHDFGAAGWLFGGVVLWRILRQPHASEPSDNVADILRTVIFLMRLCLVGIVLFGVVRMLAYKKFEWNAAAGDAQITLLWAKHALLTVVFGWGLIQYLKATKVVGRANKHE